MTPQEQHLLTALLDNLKSAQTPQVDVEAARQINQALASRADAAYLLVQQFLIQQMALRNAQTEIDELKRAASNAGSAASQFSNPGFLPGNATGRSGWTATTPDSSPRRAADNPTPDASMNTHKSSIPSFLQTAATTAAGVAGGALLFQGVESLLGHTGGGWGSPMGGAASGPVENNTVINEYVSEDSKQDPWQANDDNDSEEIDFVDTDDDNSWV
jgi:uncharacterized protein